MDDPIEEAKRYRERARELRVSAEAAPHPYVRESHERMASHYDQLASGLEEIAKLRQRKRDRN